MFAKLKFSLLSAAALVFLTLLAFSSGGTAYGQSSGAPPVFFTPQQYQTSQARNSLAPALATCAVPNVTITHSPGYAASKIPTQTLYANLAATPNAVCNDGTPAAFLFRPGYGAAASRWVIYLDEGGDCDTEAACISRVSRGVTNISSAPYSEGTAVIKPEAGILSTSPVYNPDFYDANLVQIAYCSSDYWLGEKTGNTAMTPAQIQASGNIMNWYFEGHGIVQGVIQLLQQNYGLNNATDVLLVGGSAGAVGTYMNANFVSGLLPLSTRFAAAADSGYSMTTYPDYDKKTGGDEPAPTNAENDIPQWQSVWNGIGDFTCAEASIQAGGAANAGKCFEMDVLAQNAGYQIPFFIKASYYDATLLQTYNVTGPLTAAQQPYVNAFGTALQQSLSSANPWISIFALSNNLHDMINHNNTFDTPFPFPNNVSISLAGAVGAWYRAPCTLPRWMQAASGS